MAPLLDGLRILVLEDEALIAMDVEQLCLEHGASHVTVLGDLAEISAEAAATGFDAAILDLMLGGVSTLDFARQTGNAMAVVKAAETLAKLHGHLTDKLDVSAKGDVAFVFPAFAPKPEPMTIEAGDAE